MVLYVQKEGLPEVFVGFTLCLTYIFLRESDLFLGLLDRLAANSKNKT